jgi:hypothetical protein
VDRDQQILVERSRGDTRREIGERHGLSHEAVRLIVVREGRNQIDDLELRLLANRKTGDVELYLIPDHGGPEFDLAIDYFQWCLRQLAERGVETQIHYRPVPNGVAFGIEDVTNYGEDR